MSVRWDLREHVSLGAALAKWLTLSSLLGIAVGALVALFLWLLERATELQWQHHWLLYLLPLAGAAVGGLYQLFGQSVEGGNNLIVEQIHEPGGGIPGRMAPLVLIGTLITHLCGGSAGREGTAVQMGGSVAGMLARLFRLKPGDVRILLMAGVAAGFGAVFGTPLAGAIFAMEVAVMGRISYEALIPCLAASIVGDSVTTALGIRHSHYHISALSRPPLIGTPAPLDWLLIGKVCVASIAFGVVSVLFAELAHGVQHLFKTWIRRPILRPVAGGLLVIALVQVVGTRDYLGLGVAADPHSDTGVCIQSCFQDGGAAGLSWWWKALFTAVTVGSGFKGGEVTPLFFIGAALGNVLGVLLGAPVDLMAGLGFVAVFAGATNTPLACTVMAIELFAPGNGELLSSGFVVYVSIACFLSYFLSGHSGIYLSQRVGTPKTNGQDLPPEATLRDVRGG